eukprot:6299821-Amphidinium_carterae.1
MDDVVVGIPCRHAFQHGHVRARFHLTVSEAAPHDVDEGGEAWWARKFASRLNSNLGCARGPRYDSIGCMGTWLWFTSSARLLEMAIG